MQTTANVKAINGCFVL